MKISEIGIFLTRQCNFKCPYCCVHTGDDPSDKLNLLELKDLVAQARDLGAKKLLIAGEGEPLLDKNLFPLIEYATTLNMQSRVATNMSLINDDIAKQLLKHKVKLILKLNSLNPQKQDFLAGKHNSHVWVPYKCNGREFIIPAGLKCLFNTEYFTIHSNMPFKKLLIIESVITNLNLDDLIHIAYFCKATSLSLYLETLLPPTINHPENFKPTAEQEQHLFKNVAKILGLPFILIPLFRCPFETNPFFDYCGNIRFCFAVDKSVGNIRDKSLLDLHKEQLRLKNKLGNKSTAINFLKPGLCNCRTRRLINL